jgi:type I restriction enzyme S subunit
MINLNQKILLTLKIYYPSLPEQTGIVRRVEARYHAARAQADKLTPAILAKAFRGKLVPQDPNDEPVGELLDRIRASRTENAATPKPKRSLGKKISTTDKN